MSENIRSVSAVDIIFLFRIEGEGVDAWKVALQTDTSTEESRDFETTGTKDGSIKTAGDYEGSHSLESLMPDTVEGRAEITKLKKLVRDDNPDKLEVWSIDRSAIKDETTLPAEYSTDYVTSVNSSAGSEGAVEVSIETEVDGKIIDGDVEVTPELLAILKTISDVQTFKQPTKDEIPGA